MEADLVDIICRLHPSTSDHIDAVIPTHPQALIVDCQAWYKDRLDAHDCLRYLLARRFGDHLYQPPDVQLQDTVRESRQLRESNAIRYSLRAWLHPPVDIWRKLRPGDSFRLLSTWLEAKARVYLSD